MSGRTTPRSESMKAMPRGHVFTDAEWAAITSKTACFRDDQRTFQMSLDHRGSQVARYKREGYKIELFYFLAQRWLDRAWASTSEERPAAWWGNGDHERCSHDCRLFSVHSR